MGIRAFAGPQTTTGAAQPIFGTALTAAITISADIAGKTGPGANQTQQNVTVTSTKGFLPGDVVAIGPTASFKPGIATSNPDTGTVKSITSSTVMVVQGLQNAHAATGEWVILNEDSGNVFVEVVSLTGGNIIYLGRASTVSATDVSVFWALGPQSVFNTQNLGLSHPWQLTEFWAFDTGSGDTFIAGFSQI